MMSNTPTTGQSRATRRPVSGICSEATDKGLRLEGTWYDYGIVFKEAERPAPAKVMGMVVLATLVEAPKLKQSFVASIEKIEPAPADAGSSEASAEPQSSSATPSPEKTVTKLTVKQKNYILANPAKRGHSAEAVDNAVNVLFGYPLAELSKFRAEKVVGGMIGFIATPEGAATQS